MTDALTKSETSRLEQLETRIERNLESFFQVGADLLEIRDSRLYRRDHPTFESYCLERWDMSRGHAYRLIDATEMRKELVDHGIKILPQNEAQIRPLKKIKDPERRAEALGRAIKMSTVGDITERKIEAIVEGF